MSPSPFILPRTTAPAVLGMLLLLAITGTAFAQGAKKPDGAGPPATMVEVDAVKIAPYVQTVPVIGRFVARQAGVVSARSRGAVQSMEVDVGDRVNAGDVMAVLVRDRLKWERNLYLAEAASYAAQAETNKAKTTLLRQELGRLLSLKNSPAFSQARLDDKNQAILVAESETAQAQAQLRKAQANLKLHQIDFEDGEIKAPYGGVVTQKHTAVGSYVNVGSPVFSLIDDTTLEIEADVPSDRIASLKSGTMVHVSLNKKSSITAAVRAVVPEENPQTRTRAVRFQPIQMDGVENLAANQSVTLNLPSGTQTDALSVHKDAVLNRRGNQLIFVVDNGRAKERRVELGDATGNRFIILEGLQQGDLAVIRGNERLRDGQPVRYEGMPEPTAGQVQSEQRTGPEKVKG
ncbi:MAG: efflux RND transporter periplasmic adaptor subunit [Rhodospirillales bacterium]|nr:efflux RND transporter periplasmic adaptor subunit [Rhodospirillales bacterium]